MPFGAITTTGIPSSIKAIGTVHFRCRIPFSMNVEISLTLKRLSKQLGNYILFPDTNN
jgi:hypothetical protein